MKTPIDYTSQTQAQIRQMEELQRTQKQFDSRIDRQWVCPGCGNRFELEDDINDCRCWSRSYTDSLDTPK